MICLRSITRTLSRKQNLNKTSFFKVSSTVTDKQINQNRGALQKGNFNNHYKKAKSNQYDDRISRLVNDNGFDEKELFQYNQSFIKMNINGLKMRFNEKTWYITAKLIYSKGGHQFWGLNDQVYEEFLDSLIQNKNNIANLNSIILILRLVSQNHTDKLFVNDIRSIAIQMVEQNFMQTYSDNGQLLCILSQTIVIAEGKPHTDSFKIIPKLLQGQIERISTTQTITLLHNMVSAEFYEQSTIQQIIKNLDEMKDFINIMEYGNLLQTLYLITLQFPDLLEPIKQFLAPIIDLIAEQQLNPQTTKIIKLNQTQFISLILSLNLFNIQSTPQLIELAQIYEKKITKDHWVSFTEQNKADYANYFQVSSIQK